MGAFSFFIAVSAFACFLCRAKTSFASLTMVSTVLPNASALAAWPSRDAGGMVTQAAAPWAPWAPRARDPSELRHRVRAWFELSFEVQ